MKRTKYSDKINKQINKHASEAMGWELQPMAKKLNKFAKLFQETLFKEEKIPAPLISIDSANIRTLGTYRIGYNGMGIRDHININVLWLTQRSLFLTLVTLCHEMGHTWEYSKLPEDERTKNWYHKKKFRSLMANWGINISERGVLQSVDEDGVFTKLLKKHGVEPSEMPAIKQKRKKAGRRGSPKRVLRPQGRSTLKKWSCDCTNVRCAVKLKATCDKCGQPFINREES